MHHRSDITDQTSQIRHHRFPRPSDVAGDLGQLQPPLAQLLLLRVDLRQLAARGLDLGEAGRPRGRKRHQLLVQLVALHAQIRDLLIQPLQLLALEDAEGPLAGLGLCGRRRRRGRLGVGRGRRGGGGLAGSGGGGGGSSGRRLLGGLALLLEKLEVIRVGRVKQPDLRWGDLGASS
jgi:hypothetical protein